MGKRILLFVATNIAIMVTLSIVMAILGIGGYTGPGGQLDYGALMIFCLFWGMGGAFLSLQVSRFIAKRAMGVQLVDAQTAPPDLAWLYRTVERLTRQAGLPMPEVGFYESPEVNAFATGPSQKRSLVAVSSGLLRAMQKQEAEAVLAHEVAHIKNGDMVTMTLIQGVVNAFVMFFARIIAHAVRQMADERFAAVLSFVVLIVMQIVLGVFGMMIVAWFSRAREFRADAGAAALAGRGSMIAALERLRQTHELVDTSVPSLQTMKIDGARSWTALLSTHPPLEARIRALQQLT